MDAAKLREAIDDARRWATPGERHGVATDRLGEWLRLLADAAEAHLSTLPKTKEVDVWHVECAFADNGYPCVVLYRDERSARDFEMHHGKNYTCIRVTGPHRHTVPA